MFSQLLDKIDDIFVGRKEEIKSLERKWDNLFKKQQHKVHFLLNSPGVGKTALLEHFGNNLTSDHKALYVHAMCKSRDITKKRIVNNFLLEIREWFDYSENKKKLARSKIFERRLEELDTSLDSLIRDEQVDEPGLADFLQKLSGIIPIFLVFDEVQEYQAIILSGAKNSGYPEETSLHYLAELLSNCLFDRILMVVSGTHYHILHQIGNKIGSPLNGKTEQFILGKMTSTEIHLYLDEIFSLMAQVAGSVNKTLFGYLSRFMYSFGGGHPRTMVKIAGQFLLAYPELTTELQNMNYDSFRETLHSSVLEVLRSNILSSTKVEAIQRMHNRNQYALVKEWVIKGGSNNLELGPKSTLTELVTLKPDKEELEALLYELMTIGIILQNGLQRYYLTSYYHYLEYLSIYSEKYESFLQEVIQNRYFQWLCGEASGFGFTFENIIISSLFSQKKRDFPFPINASQLIDARRMEGLVDWKMLHLEPNILYHSPQAKAVDLILVQSEVLWLIQVTTQQSRLKEKVINLAQLVRQVNVLKPQYIVKGWFVSFFGKENVLTLEEHIVYTLGDTIREFLGSELYDKIAQYKKSASS